MGDAAGALFQGAQASAVYREALQQIDEVWCPAQASARPGSCWPARQHRDGRPRPVLRRDFVLSGRDLTVLRRMRSSAPTGRLPPRRQRQSVWSSRLDWGSGRFAPMGRRLLGARRIRFLHSCACASTRPICKHRRHARWSPASRAGARWQLVLELLRLRLRRRLCPRDPCIGAEVLCTLERSLMLGAR